MQQRSSLQIVAHVWSAIFLREATARMNSDRLGWSWIFLEPILHMLLFILIRELMGRIRYISGAEFIPWMAVGMIGFFVFREAMSRGMSAVNANKALFTYRQVFPIDTVIVRCLVEFTIKCVVFLLLALGLAFFGFKMMPGDALQGVIAWVSLWFLGLGVALVLSVPVSMIPETEKFFSLTTLPLYFLSGVIMPLQLLPQQIREYMLYNPIVHGLETLRQAFFPAYHTLQGIDLTYLHFWSVSLILFGMMLHIRFRVGMIAQ